MNIVEKLSQELNITKNQVEGAVELLDQGATVPFIARYRKEATGSLEDHVLRDLQERLEYLRGLDGKKSDILRLLAEQENLTPELEKEIEKAVTMTRLDDIYLPFRPKKRTRGTVAREKGLEPLAKMILAGEDFESLVKSFITDEVESEEEAIKLAMDIMAEDMSEDADLKGMLRNVAVKTATMKTSGSKENTPYEMYYDREEVVVRMPSHRVLAINRGEKEGFLKVNLTMDDERALRAIKSRYITRKEKNNEIINKASEDAFKRLIYPSLERELRNTLTERAEDASINVFKENLKSLLLQPPLKGYYVMGFDPGLRTGCKVAVLDDTGKYLDNATVYPTMPREDIIGTKKVLKGLIKKHGVHVISLGNGTASRESELVLMEMIEELKEEGLDVSYVITNEAGASVYSASKLAGEEYPDLDVTIRGAISIARRLQDPMAELVKIDPKSIGVGQYQHDMGKKKLDQSLSGVVEDTVNRVGVDLNVATSALLSYVSGINKSIAENIVAYRDESGKFTSRKELKKVKRLGDKAFEQCAGFLRVPESAEPLDHTAVHPESYSIARPLLGRQISSADLPALAQQYNIGLPTLSDIVEELKKPGRDPREEMPKPILRSDVLSLADLKEGMILTGTVRNVVDFGAFVDIGVKEDGLVHISKISDKYIKHPSDVLQVADIVKVKIIGIDAQRNKISLSMRDV